MKIQHIKITDTLKILAYWESVVYSEYRESLEYRLHKTHNSL